MLRPIATSAFIAILISVSTVSADPFTYNFVYPEWTNNDDVVVFGINPIVSVTVDNGSANNSMQVFDLSTDVVEVTVTANGGTFSNSWTGAEIFTTGGSDFEYISTDASGIAILDLTTDRNSRVVFSNAGGTWQFGTEAGFTESWLEDEPAFSSPDEAFHAGGTDIFIRSVIPEPTSFAILGVLGAGLLIKRRK
ncbi:MAG: PEP-CTERM sorting domain-containing protein [Planctomycetota bacterium]